MRTECQQAEVALSYLRRLIQGRLDIVHTYLEHPGSDALPRPGHPGQRPARDPLLRPGPPARARAPAPCCCPPTPRRSDLTAELDAVLGADEIGTLADMDVDQLPSMAGRLEALESRVSARSPGPARADRRPPGRIGRPPQDGTSLGRRPALVKDPIRTEGTQFVEGAPGTLQRAGLVHPRAAELGPALVAPALGAGRHLEPVPEPDRAWAAPARRRRSSSRSPRPSASRRRPSTCRPASSSKPDGDTDLSRHIFADHHLTEEQRQAMMRIYLSFRHENEDQAERHRLSTVTDAARAAEPMTRPWPPPGRPTRPPQSLVGAVPPP